VKKPSLKSDGFFGTSLPELQRKIMNKENSAAEEIKENSGESRPRDDRFADPKTDEDPRTADHGRTSVGASDLNADAATVDTGAPEDVPGVRRG
jgi:hypothetical protein